jgi:uncharacterized membrane protein
VNRDRLTWPRREVTRLEGFSDAVFAFALTLLVVSLEVPRTFDELLVLLRGAPAFAISFALFWLIWRQHHEFFRRYGMEDARTITLNALLLFVVLLYVYPLKFLFTHLVVDPTRSPEIRPDQLRMLMVIYSAGYAAVWGIFGLMYRHALARREDLGMTPHQIFETRAHGGAMALHVLFGVLSVTIALLVPLRLLAVAGLMYFLVGPAQWVYWSRVARHRKAALGLKRAPHVRNEPRT